jgi:hypothetical protein
MLGRFVSADSIVPDFANPQGLNRYSYAGNNTLRFTDPTGHYEFEEDPDDHFQTYRLTKINWLGLGLVRFEPGGWGAGDKDAALLALDMVHLVTGLSPHDVVMLVTGRANGPLRFVSDRGDNIGGGYANGWVTMTGANLDNAFLSNEGMYILLHEMAHGIDESFGIGQKSFTALGGFNSVGWKQDKDGKWQYSGSTDFGLGRGPATAYALEGPHEDFAETFASVVIERILRAGRPRSITGDDLFPIIRFAGGDANRDGVVGLGEIGNVDDARRKIVWDEFNKRFRYR